MFNYMDKFNVIARGNGGGGGGGGRDAPYGNGATKAQIDYTRAMRSAGYVNTRYYGTKPQGIDRQKLARTGKTVAKVGGVVGGLALGAGGPTFAARVAGGAIMYGADKIRP